VPNTLTIGRVVAIPALATAYVAPSGPAVACLPAFLFALTALTDALDGYLARRWDAQSPFGAFLDPVADKLLVCVCLVLLSGTAGPAIALPTALIVSREIVVSALREWMAARGLGSRVAVGPWGKVKTAAQMAALQLLLLARAAAGVSALRTASRLWSSGMLLLWVATVLTVTSALGYVATALPVLLGETSHFAEIGHGVKHEA
jgi:CDP-diacylglycerol--glycerol-3-phosphate 3-phosphatidyltransferase